MRRTSQPRERKKNERRQNTGPLIALAKANCLDLLERLFGSVEIPPAVYHELFASRKPDLACLNKALARFIQTVPSLVIPSQVQTVTDHLGEGEQQAIALAIDRHALLLMDDHAGRVAARRLGVLVTGSIGVLIRAKERGWVTHVLPLLQEIRERGYWLSDELLAEAARRAGE